MSLDSGNLLGCYTELEIAAGIPDLVDGFQEEDSYYDYSKAEYDDREEDRNELISEIKHLTEPYDPEKRTILSQEIAGLESSADAKSVAIQQLISDNLDYIISRFGRKEGIPEAYLKLLKDQSIIQSMIKGFFKKYLNINLNSELLKEINSLIKKLQYNSEMETPYNRVTEIQSYIYNKARFVIGVDGHKKLPKKQMGIILACSRANLSILDTIQSKNRKISYSLNLNGNSRIPNNYFGYIFNKSSLQAELENSYPTVIDPINGSYKPKWKVRFMKPISYYCEEETRHKIDEIISIDDSKAIFKVKEECVNIYSR